MTSPDELLSRKEIASLFKRHRITVYRWEREGLRLIDGRATAADVAWFLEQREAAERLGLPIAEFLEKPREVREQLLKAAFLLANPRAGSAGSVQHHATSPDATGCAALA